MVAKPRALGPTGGLFWSAYAWPGVVGLIAAALALGFVLSTGLPASPTGAAEPRA